MIEAALGTCHWVSLAKLLARKLSLEWQVHSTSWSRGREEREVMSIAVRVCAVGLQRSVRPCLSLDHRELETRYKFPAKSRRVVIKSQGRNGDPTTLSGGELYGAVNQNAVFVAN